MGKLRYNELPLRCDARKELLVSLLEGLVLQALIWHIKCNHPGGEDK